MSVNFRVTLALAIFLVLVLPSFTAQAAEDEQTVHYIAIGDSLAAGIGSSLPRTRGYPPTVQHLLEQHKSAKVQLTNLAKPGETTDSFLTDGQLSVFNEVVLAINGGVGEIELVSVSLGGNEILNLHSDTTINRDQALATFEQNIEDVAESVRFVVGEHTTVVFTSYYDLTSGDPAQPGSDAWWINRFNAAIESAANNHQAVTADVHSLFQGNIGNFTHAPIDVHPTNEGYVAIANSIWGASGSDTQPPVITVLSESTSTRPTPTLQFLVADDTDVAHVTVHLDDDDHIPHYIGDQTYVLLLDFRDRESKSLTLEIQASDSAGNTNIREHEVSYFDSETVINDQSERTWFPSAG